MKKVANKLTEEEKVIRFKKRKVLRIIIIILGFLTIITSIHVLFTKTLPILPVIFLILEVIAARYRESLDINVPEKKKD